MAHKFGVLQRRTHVRNNSMNGTLVWANIYRHHYLLPHHHPRLHSHNQLPLTPRPFLSFSHPLLLSSHPHPLLR